MVTVAFFSEPKSPLQSWLLCTASCGHFQAASLAKKLTIVFAEVDLLGWMSSTASQGEPIRELPPHFSVPRSQRLAALRAAGQGNPTAAESLGSTRSAGYAVRVIPAGGFNGGYILALSYKARVRDRKADVAHSNGRYGKRWRTREEITQADMDNFRKWVDNGMATGGGSSSKRSRSESPLQLPTRSSSRVDGVEAKRSRQISPQPVLLPADAERAHRSSQLAQEAAAATGAEAAARTAADVAAFIATATAK